MDCTLSRNEKSSAAQQTNLQVEETMDSQGVWHAPAISVIDIRRTMAAAGAYIDGGTGSSF
jgi:hypothetical protein